MEATFSMFSRPESRALQTGLKLAEQPATPMRLAEKYRPATLAQVVGQGEIKFRIEGFLEAPYSTAFLFEGSTGVGKTTVAKIIASELGAVEYGGLEVVKSGMQDAEEVTRILKNLRYTPMLGSGWKVVIVDEADYMSTKAGQIWLSALEDLPDRTVIIFTTNNPGKFADRFLDRCERIEFQSSPELLAQDAQALLNDIWNRERLAGSAPAISTVPGIIERSHLSFRRVVNAVETLKHQPQRQASTPIAIPDQANRRRQAALKAAATRRANQIAKGA